jgi:hypothetical protein
MRARLVTLIALASARPAGDHRPGPHDAVQESELFGIQVRPGWTEFVESRWRPWFDAVRVWSADEYGAPHAGTAYRVLGCRTARVIVPMAATLLLIDLSLDADVDALVLAEKDAFDPNVRLTLGGTDVVAAALERAPVGELTGPAASCCCCRVPEPDRFLFGNDPGSLSDGQERILRQMMFKDVDISYRPGMAPPRTISSSVIWI